MKAPNPASTPPVMMSMTRMAMFAAHAIGESFWPKQTGHASAARGAAAATSVTRAVRRMLETPRLPLECRPVDSEPRAARERRHGHEHVADAVVRAILP